MKRRFTIPPINNSDISQIFIILFHSLIILKSIVGVDSGVFAKVLIGGYIMLGVFVTLRFKLKANLLILYCICSMLLSACITFIFSPNYRINDLILIFVYFGIALIPIYTKLNYKLFLRFTYGVLLFFLVAFFVIDDPNHVFQGMSRNQISVILLIILGYHIISCVQNEKKPSFFLIALSFAMTIWATGRGGIIAIGLLLIAYPFYIKAKKIYKQRILLLLIVLPMVTYHFYPHIFKNAFQRFYGMGTESARSNLNEEYAKKSCESLTYFLFGAPFYELPMSIELGMDSKATINPHNSFIRIHIYYGLFGLILLLLLLSYASLYYLKTKNYAFFVLLIALLFRSLVDSTAFHGPSDTLIYYLIFYAIRNVSVVPSTSETVLAKKIFLEIK